MGAQIKDRVGLDAKEQESYSPNGSWGQVVPRAGDPSGASSQNVQGSHTIGKAGNTR